MQRNRIVIFRALQLGDLLCSIPALRAIRATHPAAHISLVGLPAARPLLARLPPYVDEWIAFPGADGFPEQPPDPEGLASLLAMLRERRFDLAIQLHGAGDRSNAIVEAFGAVQTAGFYPPGQSAPAGHEKRFISWPEALPEVQRYLSLTRWLGFPDCGEHLELAPTAADRLAFHSRLSTYGLAPGEYVIVHPGARLRSRRWPAAAFAEVARALGHDGYRIVVTGSAAEQPLTRTVLTTLLSLGGYPAVDLTGQTSLGEMALLIGSSALLVCNDTGVSHVAAAMRATSLVIACGSDTHRWAPLDSERHPVLSVPVSCRPCAYDDCPIGHPCALELPVSTVIARARQQLDNPNRYA